MEVVGGEAIFSSCRGELSPEGEGQLTSCIFQQGADPLSRGQ